MYYGYTRVSTDTQAERGHGLDVQKDAIATYAKAHQIKIDFVFTDAGISGTTETRPALDKLLLETLSAGDTIIVHNTSRLWRSLFAQATIMKAVMAAGAAIVSIDEPEFDVYRYMTDPDNFMISGMMGMLDQWERMTIARKLSRGRATKAAQGNKPAGACPYGYQYATDKKSVEVNPARAEVVKHIFTMAQTGASAQAIADELNDQSIPSARGGLWSAGSIIAILHNRFYLGELVHAGETIEGKHAALISKVQFGKVQKQLDKRAKK